jgi:hypothetical protein
MIARVAPGVVRCPMTWLTLVLTLLSVGQSDFQLPAIQTIDFYGLRTVSEAQVRKALQIKEGSMPPESTLPAQLRVEAIDRVIHARLNFVCCEKGKTTLYVGIQEQDVPALEFRPAPTGSVRLPFDVLPAGDAFEKAFERAMESGDHAEDQSQGHSLMHFPEARSVQQKFISLAALHPAILHDVLRNSADAHQRALAAQILGYAVDKRDVTADLIYATRDPDDEVRNNATRALWLIAKLAQRKPDLGIQVPASVFIDLLNSLVWTDRNKSSYALLETTFNRDPATLAEIRAKALPSLIEMARWKAIAHAQPAIFLLGRIGGMSEDDIQAAIDRGDREAVISAGLKPKV